MIGRLLFDTSCCDCLSQIFVDSIKWLRWWNGWQAGKKETPPQKKTMTLTSIVISKWNYLVQCFVYIHMGVGDVGDCIHMLIHTSMPNCTILCLGACRRALVSKPVSARWPLVWNKQRIIIIMDLLIDQRGSVLSQNLIINLQLAVCRPFQADFSRIF